MTCNYRTKHQIAIVICIDSASVGIVPPLYGIMQFRPKTALAPASANVKGNRSTLHTCQLSRLRLDSPDFTTWKKPFPLSRLGKQKHYKIPILKKVTRLRQLTPDFQPKFKIPRRVLANSQSEIGITSSHYCLLVYTCVACRVFGRCELVWFTRFTCVEVFIRLNEEHILIAINREDGFQVGLFFTQT